MPVESVPQFIDLERAAERIAAHAHVTPVLRSHSLDALTGAQLYFKCENLQRTGAFKFRGACNAVWSLADAIAGRGVVTHSSGNHGAALAMAGCTRGIPVHVVVPDGAVKSKVAAIEAYGGILHRCAPTLTAREVTAEQVRTATGATLVHPYADARVIAGQGTAALELIREVGELDAVIAPIGGGGLIGGSAIATSRLLPQARMFAAEPTGAADAYDSMQRGARVQDLVPDTLCDGLRGLIGAVNFSLLQAHAVTVLPVEDDATVAAMRLLWQRLKLIVEPSAAIVLAAILAHPQHFAGRRIGVILSGGNVDLDALPWMR